MIGRSLLGILCWALSTSAVASESISNIAVLGLDKKQFEKLQLCGTASSGDPAKAAAACTELMPEPSFKKRLTNRSALYLYRSVANLRLGKLKSAIEDADQAGRDLPNDANNENQRCWARAFAGVELDIAMRACLRSIERGGATPRRLDSLALVHLRRGEWMAAVSEYDFAGRWMKDSLYGRLLAEYGFRAAQKDADDRAQFLKERIVPLERELGADGIESARKKFDAMGITRASVEEQAQKR
jgi:tetratricopeptide (TPR) repeat protein